MTATGSDQKPEPAAGGVSGQAVPDSEGREPAASPRDWFLAAIEADGSVDHCLAAVLAEINRKSVFIMALKTNLAPREAGGLDAISDLAQRVKALEKTLRFRLGMLRPERPAAWFRAPAATNLGPFASSVIEEPVFGHYEPGELEAVKRGLADAWRDRRVGALPFKDSGASLWRTLLQLNAAWERIALLPEPFAGLRLDLLPQGLPVDLESRALRAFLVNVRNEMAATRQRLNSCHLELTQASMRFWEHQRQSTPGGVGGDFRREQARPGGGAQPGGERPRPSHAAADHAREAFRRRRTAAPLRPLLTPADLDALKVMGFHDFPSSDSLRQRYLSLAKQLHPDRVGGNDGAFKALVAAYTRLTERLPAMGQRP